MRSARQGERRGDLEELAAHHHRGRDTEHLVESARQVRRVGEVRGMRRVRDAGLAPDSEHRSRELTPQIVSESDLILAMAPSHLARVKELDPNANVHLLAGYSSGSEGHPIQDPFGGDLAAYRDAFDEIEKELSGLLERIPAT